MYARDLITQRQHDGINPMIHRGAGSLLPVPKEDAQLPAKEYKLVETFAVPNQEAPGEASRPPRFAHVERPGEWRLRQKRSRVCERFPYMMWPPACDSDRQGRPTASVAELTGMLDLSGWPKTMRVIVHERAWPQRPAAQPRFTDVRDGRFLYASDTNTASSRGWHYTIVAAPAADEIIPSSQRYRPAQSASPITPKPGSGAN